MTDDLVRNARRALSELLAHDADAAIGVWHTLANEIYGHLPALELTVQDDAETLAENDGEPREALKCPHCHSLIGDDDLAECNWGYQHDRISGVSFDSRELRIYVDQTPDLDGLGFECEHCGKGVRLPDGWSVNYR